MPDSELQGLLSFPYWLLVLLCCLLLSLWMGLATLYCTLEVCVDLGTWVLISQIRLTGRVSKETLIFFELSWNCVVMWGSVVRMRTFFATLI